MSVYAMVWVKKYAPTINSTEMCILYALADRANDDGRGCWPYYATLADESRCSVPTVKRHIKALEDRGLIVRGDQSQVADYPPDKRPVVWDLNMGLRREKAAYQSDTPGGRGINGDKAGYQTEQSEVSTVTKRGITGDTHNLPITTHTTSLQPTNDHSAFDEWWEHYPKKVGKGQARTAFRRALKKVDLGTLMDGTRQLAAHHQQAGTDKKFIPNPSTWLNGERWDDELIPFDGERTPSVDEVLSWNVTHSMNENQEVPF